MAALKGEFHRIIQGVSEGWSRRAGLEKDCARAERDALDTLGGYLAQAEARHSGLHAQLLDGIRSIGAIAAAETAQLDQQFLRNKADCLQQLVEMLLRYLKNSVQQLSAREKEPSAAADPSAGDAPRADGEAPDLRGLAAEIAELSRKLDARKTFAGFPNYQQILLQIAHSQSKLNERLAALGKADAGAS